MTKITEGMKKSVNDWWDSRGNEAQARFIAWVANEEKTDTETAILMCSEGSGCEKPQYTLGYKLAPPGIMTDLYLTPGKKARAKKVAEFEANLNADELVLFRSECDGMGKLFKQSLRSKKRA